MGWLPVAGPVVLLSYVEKNVTPNVWGGLCYLPFFPCLEQEGLTLMSQAWLDHHMTAMIMQN